MKGQEQKSRNDGQTVLQFGCLTPHRPQSRQPTFGHTGPEPATPVCSGRAVKHTHHATDHFHASAAHNGVALGTLTGSQLSPPSTSQTLFISQKEARGCSRHSPSSSIRALVAPRFLSLKSHLFRMFRRNGTIPYATFRPNVVSGRHRAALRLPAWLPVPRGHRRLCSPSSAGALPTAASSAETASRLASPPALIHSPSVSTYVAPPGCHGGWRPTNTGGHCLPRARTTREGSGRLRSVAGLEPRPWQSGRSEGAGAGRPGTRFRRHSLSGPREGRRGPHQLPFPTLGVRLRPHRLRPRRCQQSRCADACGRPVGWAARTGFHRPRPPPHAEEAAWAPHLPSVQRLREVRELA